MSADDNLQFDKAEPQPGAAPVGGTCARCQAPITAPYYQALGRAFCASCKAALEAQLVSPFKAATFVKALLFGAVGALGGALVYFGVVAATGYEIGLIAILVGFMVGYMVRRGTGNRGGRSYQVMALLLTYLAIGSTYASLALRHITLDRLIPLLFVGPVIAIVGNLPGSLISGLIIGFALRQAWIMNTPLAIDFKGPFRVGSAPA